MHKMLHHGVRAVLLTGDGLCLGGAAMIALACQGNDLLAVALVLVLVHVGNLVNTLLLLLNDRALREALLRTRCVLGLVSSILCFSILMSVLGWEDRNAAYLRQILYPLLPYGVFVLGIGSIFQLVPTPDPLVRADTLTFTAVSQISLTSPPPPSPTNTSSSVSGSPSPRNPSPHSEGDAEVDLEAALPHPFSPVAQQA